MNSLGLTLFETKHHADLTFKFASGDTLKSHKCVLQCNPIFSGILSHETGYQSGSIFIDDHSVEVFTLLIKYLYTGTVEFSPRVDLLQVLLLLKDYPVTGFVNQMQKYFRVSVNWDNYKGIIREEYYLEYEGIAESLIMFVVENIDALEYSEIPEDVMKGVVRCIKGLPWSEKGRFRGSQSHGFISRRDVLSFHGHGQGGFGSTGHSQSTSGFGSSSQSTSGFGSSSQSTGVFGSTAHSQSTGGFGASAQGQSSSGFGSPIQSQSTGVFGSTAHSQSTGGFGSPAHSQSIGGFGFSAHSQSTGGFGSPSQSTGGGFGSPSQSTGGFGSTGYSQSTGGFGSTAYSQGTSGFGSPEQRVSTSEIESATLRTSSHITGFGSPAGDGLSGAPSTQTTENMQYKF